MKEKEIMWKELNDLLVVYQAQKDKLYACFQELVGAVQSGSINSETEIKALVDILGDYCEDERFCILFQDLFRHIYCNYPQMLGKYKRIFEMLL